MSKYYLYRCSEKEKTLLSEKLNNATKQLAGIQEERRELQEASHKLNLSVKGCEREKKELQDR